jgi:hypothetical protein
MVGESACGHWELSKCRRYIFGANLFWLGDCDVVRNIFEYDVPIPQLKRWGQDMLGCTFTLLYRSCRSMHNDDDADAINRQYDNSLILTYISKGAALHNASMISHPESYTIASLRYLTKKLSAEPHHLSPSQSHPPPFTRRWSSLLSVLW